jgi:putative endonuclease
MSGSGRHHTGLAAEEAAARRYVAEGAAVAASRWRCAHGELDLVLRFPDLVVFAEIKARRDHAVAAASVSPRQWRRIAAAASLWLAEHAPADMPCRFDLVTVDACGRCERIENVFAAEF